MNNKVLKFIISSIFIVVFNVVFYIVFGFDNPKDIWICYIFTMTAYCCILFTSFFIKKERKNYILGLSLYAVSFYYFYLQIMLCYFYLFHRELGYNLLLAAQIMLFGAYLFVFIANLIANNKTYESIEKQEKEIDFIKTNAAKLKRVQEETDNKELAKKLERLYDLFHSSQSKSNSSVKSLEDKIQFEIEKLNTNNKDELQDQIKTIEKLIKERNSILQKNKE